MKQSWEIKKLGEVYDVRDGTHDSPKYVMEGFPLITSKNLKNDNLNYDNVNYISEQDYININKRSKVDVGDVLFAMIGTIGNPIVIKNEPDFAIKNIALFKVPKNQDSYFLKYYLDSGLVIEQMTKDAKGATQKFVGLGYLRNFEIPLPPLPEQRRIVTVLDEAFAAIAKALANAEQNLKNAKELFESLLLKIFIEGINVKKWNLEKLEKYNKVVVGYVGPISKEYTNDEDGVLLLSTKNIGVKGVSLEKLTRINHQFHNKNKKSQLLPGDILVARHGNSGQSAVIPNEIKMAHALNVIVIKKSETLSSEYICFLLNSGVLDKIAASKGGSVQEIINTSVIKDLIIPVPSVKEQQVIVQKLDALSAETKKLEAIYQTKIKDLEELKKSVLQKAFAGELCRTIAVS